MIPKPDTITGCGPECVRDPDCQYGEVCLNQRCVEKPDPCDPNPCGPGAVCMTNGIGNAICRYVESPEDLYSHGPATDLPSDVETHTVDTSFIFTKNQMLQNVFDISNAEMAQWCQKS